MQYFHASEQYYFCYKRNSSQKEPNIESCEFDNTNVNFILKNKSVRIVNSFIKKRIKKEIKSIPVIKM